MFFRLRHIITILLFGLSISCHTQTEIATNPPAEVKVIQYEDLFKTVQKNDKVVYVVNFWSTWCIPCVEELPDFVAVNEEADKSGFKMYLISLDNVKNIESKVLPFIEEQSITPEVLLLDDNKRMNTWISMVDSSWDGSIPATVMYLNGKKVFFKQGTMSQEELINQINQYTSP